MTTLKRLCSRLGESWPKRGFRPQVHDAWVGISLVELRVEKSVFPSVKRLKEIVSRNSAKLRNYNMPVE